MTLFPLILAETIQGLDDCRTRRCSNLTGSPLLLQIWLQEKLSLLEKTAGNWMRYQPRNHQERHIKEINGRPVYTSVEQWIESIKTAPEEMITWTCPWWRLEHVTLCAYVNCIPILGFRSCSYYYPALVARQYGVKQQVPSRPVDFSGDRIS